MANVKIHEIRKSYDSLEVIHGLNIDIKDGEFVALVGPSGCGKSTLLRMIAGLEPIDSGNIAIGERIVNSLPPSERDIAMVFQTYALYPHKTVAENMGFALKVAKTSKAEIDRRVKEAAEILSLTEYLDRKPRHLSGGQRQRVAMGRAIVRDPQVFLFDEPLSNLDAKLRMQMRTEIKELHQRLKTTTVFVTHDQIEAMTLADRVVVMNKGIVQQVGTPTEIYDRPANVFVASFIGSPAMNLVSGHLSNGNFSSENIAISGISYANGDVTLGFRAEDATIVSGVKRGGNSKSGGTITAPVYAIELLGDATMVTVRAGGVMVAVKAGKEFRATIGDQVSIALPLAACHLFDSATGNSVAEG